MSDHPDGLAEWISTQLKCLPDQLMLNLIAGDASPRRYYRVTHKAGALPVGAGEVGHPVTSCVAMVSPASENNDAFLHVGSQLAKAGVNTPLVWAQSLPQGWFLLEDFGDEQFLSSVLSDSDSAALLYGHAFDNLLHQVRMPCEASGIPRYDAQRLQTELDVFLEWFVTGLLKIEADDLILQRFEALSDHLIASAVEQPKVWVHRDFHSRNLMVLERGGLGVIDFQDAVIGPITYDPVSLLKDCYIRWPRSQQLLWLNNYLQLLKQLNQFSQVAHVDESGPSQVSLQSQIKRVVELLSGVSSDQFRLWFDLMGLQRHLKVLGVFARLHLRDQKSDYLADLPLVTEYVREALLLTEGWHESVADFRGWFEAHLMPIIVEQPWYESVEPEGWVW